MGRRCLRLLSVCLAIAFVCQVPAAALSELEQAQRQLQQIQERIAEFERRQAQAERTSRTLAGELRQLEQRLAVTQADLRAFERKLTATQREIDLAQEALAKVEAELARRDDLLRRRVRTLAERGNVSYLDVLFDATDFGDFLTRLRTLQLIIAQDIQLFETVKAQRRERLAYLDYLDEQRARYAGLQEATRAKKASFERDQATKAALLARTQQERAEYARALDDLEQTSKEVQRLIAEIQAKMGFMHRNRADIQMVWPVPSSRWVTSPFGNRYHPILRQWRMHTGVDIAAKSGAPIVAVEMGVVIFSGWLGGYGYTIILDHGAGVSTLYAHASKLLQPINAKVTKGETISLIGSTGLSTGPHLHFEVRIAGKPVDPMPAWIKR